MAEPSVRKGPGSVRYLPLRGLSRMGRYGSGASLILSSRLGVERRLGERVDRGLYVAVERQGLRWRLNLDSNHSRSVFVRGVHDAPLLRAIKDRLVSGDVFVDIGANIGLIALPIARRLQHLGAGRVIAIEPATDVVEELNTNIALNEVGETVEVWPVAAGSAVGFGLLRTGDDQGDAGLRTLGGEGTGVGMVPITTVDVLCSENRARPTVMKIDVEGWETEVLRGSVSCLQDHALRLVIVESVEAHLTRAGSSRAELDAFLVSRGFRAHWIRHRGLSPVTDLSDLISTNLAYVR